VKRVLREDMFDVGKKKFLVLLLVIETENQDGLDFIERCLIRVREKLSQALVD